MSNMLKKILLSLALVLGMNSLNHVQAQEEVYSEVSELRECPISGQINLRLQGTLRNGRLMGFVNNQHVLWTVINGGVDGFYQGNYLRLRLEPTRNNEFTLSGFIGSYYISWRSFGGQINEYVQCR